VSSSNKRKFLIGILVFGLAFVVIGAISVTGWEYSNSNEFCANACHQVHPQEPFAHQLSPHAKVDCVECHIGRMNFFSSAIEKSGHVAHAWSMLVGYERPTHSTTLQSAKSCESCHPREAHRNNTVRVLSHFDDDRNNTERKTLLIMRLVGRNFIDQESLGMNWHASGAVRYRTDDPQGLNVTWVEATLPDGTVRTYENVRAAKGQADPTAMAGDIRAMDCATCHNRVGHPFPNPDRVVDNALRNGTLDRDLPYIKKHMTELLEQEFTTEEEALALVRKAADDYVATYPGATVKGVEDLREYLREGEERIMALKVRSRFLEDENIGWDSFPDNTGHVDGPGCFRCHNGRLQTAESVPIPVNCTTCHSIPLVSRRNQIPAHFTNILDVQTPDDHRDPAFMAKHMELFEDYCEDCHGDIDFGTDDKSHCSNSGCHDADWKYLDFDALRM
jgi:hypothetical protein